jgi:lambda family phage tail tape measure protein
MSDEGQLIGTARIDVAINTDKGTASITELQGRVRGFSADAQAAYDQLSSKLKKTTDSLVKQAETWGLSRDQLLLYKAEQANLPTAIIDELRQKLQASAGAAQQAAAAVASIGDSLRGATFSDAQLYKYNQALVDMQAKSDAARASLAALAQQAAEDDARFKAVAAAGFASQQQPIQQSARGAAASLSPEERAAQQQALQDLAAVNVAREREQAATNGAAAAQKAAAAAAQAESAALQDLLGKIDPTVAAYERLDTMEAQLRAARSKGTISQDDFDAYLLKLNKARDGIGAADAAVSHFSLSSAAARQEISRMIGELAQGNFGNLEGSLATLASRSGLITALMTPLGAAIAVAAGAVIGLGIAAVTGSEEIDTLNKAVYSTGGVVGVSTAALDQMATQLGQSTGQWTNARKAVELFAASGEVSGAGLSGLARDAVNFATATGESIQQTVQQIESIGSAPADTIAKLNEQYHVLTASQFAQIEALQEQGRTQEAARLAEQALGSAMAQRAQEVEDNAGWIVKSAHWVRDEWNAAWNAVKNVGKPDTLADQVASVQAQISKLSTPRVDRQGNLVQSNNSAEVARLQQQLQSLRQQQFDAGLNDVNQSLNAQANQAAVAAQQRLASFATPKQALDNSIAKANADRLAALYGVVDPAQISRIQAEYSEQIEKAKEAYNAAIKRQDAGATNADEAAQVKAFQDNLKAIEDAYKNSQKNLDTDRKNGTVGEDDYYQQSSALLWKAEGDEVTVIQAEINRLQTRKAIGAERIKLDGQIADLTAQASKIEQDAIAKSIDLSGQQKAADDKRTQAINAYAAALDKSNDALQAQMDADVAHIGMGDREYQQQQKINQALVDQASKLEDLALKRQAGKRGESGGITQDEYDADVAALQAATDRKVAIITVGYQRQNAARQDWENGLASGYANWADQATNVAGAVATATTNAFDQFTDSLVTALNTGKLSFHSFAISVLEDIEKIALKLAEQQAVSGILSYFGIGTFGSTGAATSGAGSFAGQGVASDISSFTFNAKGGAYSSPSLSAYSGGVYDSPHLFKFAAGAGVFGEAGPEAIMPLKRGSDGRLGVAASGSGGGVQFIQQITFSSDGSSTVSDKSSGNASDGQRQFVSLMKQVALQAINSEMRPGGMLWRGGVRVGAGQ